MADKIPIRGSFNGGSLTGLAQYATGDTLGVAHGGMGLAAVGANQLLTGHNSSTTGALTSESNLTFDGTILKSTGDLCATVKVVSPALCIGSEYVLPTADGSAGQIMCTDGSGALAFATASAGVTLAGSTNNTIATVTGSDALAGEANLTFTGTTLTVDIGASNDDNLILNADAAWNPKLTYTEAGVVKAGVEYDAGACKMRIQTGGTTNAIVIDCNQNVGIGTTAPTGLLATAGGSNYHSAIGTPVLSMRQSGSAAYGFDVHQDTDTDGDLHFHRVVNNTSAMLMTFERATGNVGINTDSPLVPLHVNAHCLTYITNFYHTHASSPYGLQIYFSGAAPDNNTTNHYLHARDCSGTDRILIWSDGDVANHDGVYGTLSDAKFKQDITDVRSYWDDFNSLQYRKFRLKTDVEVDADAPYRLGLVAQEVETIFPGLVPESKDFDTETEEAVVDADGEAVLDEDGNPTYETIFTPSGTTYKWVKSSIIEGPIMGSVVQELQTRLEAAESKITAQEAEIAILKG